ncbi:GNAT family N-acetyltransferase [Bradyrhizobium sp. GCM10027634]|uniref:GNAT family N-acetyltransferase n=1 Tax=unclassified Bradyrhizobium TaxID=2631580 RepID=UPI00188A6AF5|nr:MULTISPECIES: GNAT family N-acetyltransferase [unclassified Bradyrhizobium]MDN5005395.1 GNAT family N-acetyltransferase [Bradyrhizobium sp. WYCCWR 12677]QOZ44109.1 GNAT family N-acetyltransferase [Bradyrhizobium sp. CCBAU 53340]
MAILRQCKRKADIMSSHAVIPQADFEIRRLTVDDLDCLREIRAEAIQMHPQSFGSPEEDEGGEVMMAAYRHWLGDTIFGAFGCERLIGVAGFYVSRYKRSQHRGHIFSVFVRENDRGKGVGDRLIKKLLAHAEARVEQVHLAVVSTAVAAIKTYKRNGFEICGTDPRVVRIDEATYDNYLMMKTFGH